MISFESQLIVYIVLALAVALIVSFLMTPVVKTFAYKVTCPRTTGVCIKSPSRGWGGWPSSSASW